MVFETVVGGLETIGFFSYVIVYLLTIAIVYGILEHVSVPKSKSARATISIALGFLVLPLGPIIQPFLSRLGLGMIVVAAGILALVVMAESIGLKAGKGKHIWESHPKITGIIFIMIGLFVFAASGGLELLGFRGGGGLSFGPSLTTVFFLGIMALGIWWITNEKK